ncbi:phosphomevalonate kinase [Ischnura elegans]|uniref:phosphomevalonate kinase n=1 Tax=Ischnura elegans TaxID=197161 RepID=UPI001ED89BCE|nr:phosphomevalonate kinase [Ischnura elegans]
MPPSGILIFSGKRKSGKDYITDILHDRIGSQTCALLKLSGPIKHMWAESKNLDFEKLMDASEYKEQHRIEMIKFGEDMRNQDPGCFCRESIKMYNAEEKPIWIISDARRKTDLKWFSEKYGDKVKTVRVIADEDVRRGRGWVFTHSVDDATTECDLDDISSWDWIIANNGRGTEMEDKIQEILVWVNKLLDS